MKFNKFAPLTKLEEQGDGTLLVHALITEQQPDLDKEVCDYETTKELYAKRAAENLQKTSIVGMTPSVMPVREMHQLKAIGAGRSVEYNDAAKTIHALTHIVEPTAVLKFKAGVLIGFSQGGDYVKKWIDPDFPGCTRYTADPAEWSAVDAPCLPSALVDSMKGRTVTLMKASGGSVEVPLEIPPFDVLRLAKAEREIAELRKMVEQPKVVKRDLTEAEKSAITKACAKIALKKGMYEVGWFAELLESLNWLCLQTEFERDLEDDGSKVPEGLREAWLALLGEFKAMAIEEADELAAHGGKGAKAMKITDQAGLTKAAKTMAEHMEKHMEMHKALHEKLEGTLSKEHPIVKAHQAMMDHCEKCMKAAKDSAEGEDGETEAEKAAKIAKAAADVATADPIAKAITAAVAPLVAKVDELEKKLAKTPAVVEMPHTGAGSGVSKSIEANADFAELLK